jgi:S1-C subfamily serine protease
VTTRQVAVPLVAAVLGSAITAGAMLAGGGSGSASLARQQSIVGIGRGGERLSANEIYDRTASSVVYVSARSVQPNGRTAFDATTGSEFNLSTGSGFLSGDDGHVVTNAHVVNGATAVNVTFPDGPTVAAHVIGKDEQTDIAVLAVDPAGLDLQPLEFGDSATVRPGDPVVAVGNPTGLQTNAGTGRIAAAGQRIEAPGGYLIDGVFETDAVIEPASSGGPLVGPDGRVVGVTFRLPEEGESNGYAVPANTARDVIAKLEETGKVIRPYIGLRGSVTAGGVQVTHVLSGGPADEAGIQEGDVVESIDGRPVTTLGELFGTVDEHSPGESVELGVLRDGSRGDVKVQLLERPATVPAG